MQDKELDFEAYKRNEITHYEFLTGKDLPTGDEVKKAFRKQALKYHPDKKPGDKVAEEKFKLISNANDEIEKRLGTCKYSNEPLLDTGYGGAAAGGYGAGAGYGGYRAGAGYGGYRAGHGTGARRGGVGKKPSTDLYGTKERVKNIIDSRYFRFGLAIFGAAAMCALHRAGGSKPFLYNGWAAVLFASIALNNEVHASLYELGAKTDGGLDSFVFIAGILAFTGTKYPITSTVGSFVYFLSISSYAASSCYDPKKPSSYIDFAFWTLLCTALSSTLSKSTFINNHPYTSFFVVPVLSGVVCLAADKVAEKIKAKDTAWLAKATVATCAICAVAYGTGASKVVTGAVADLLNFPTFAEGLKVAAKYVGMAA